MRIVLGRMIWPLVESRVISIGKTPVRLWHKYGPVVFGIRAYAEHVAVAAVGHPNSSASGLKSGLSCVGMAKKRKSESGEEHLRRVRRICSAMPETTEKL